MHAKYNGFVIAGRLLRPGLTAFAVACAMLSGCASDQGKRGAPVPHAEAAEPTPVEDAPAASTSADYSLRPDAPLVYTVKKGDTLWDISRYFLRNPWDWPQLWYENPQIKNPHLIYPGEKLKLVWVNGRPRLMGDRSGVRLEPSAIVEPLNGGIPTIPISSIRTFLVSPRLVTEDQLDHAPYLLDFTDGHLAAGANDGIFVKGLPDHPSKVWSVIEPGERYVDPETGELLGYEAIPVGQAELIKGGKPATMTLSRTDREAVIGDRLLPVEEEKFNDNFYPHPPKGKIDGRIISVFDGLSDIPQYQVVAINRGERDGLDPGTVLRVLQAGSSVPDPYGTAPVRLPDQDAGFMLVFKTTHRLSFALIMSATRPIHVLDKVVSPDSDTH